MRGFALLYLLAAGDIPTFDQFHVAERFAGKPAAPILHTRAQRTFRTSIRDAEQQGPNFAGHFTLAVWGCGAGCNSMAIVDTRSGATYDGPFRLLGFDPSRVYEGGEEMIEFKIDSRLMIARGCPEEVQKDCGTYYYEWAGNRLNLLRKSPAAVKP